MTERPILFGRPMVVALMRDEKTKTRRVAKFDWDEDGPPTRFIVDDEGYWMGSAVRESTGDLWSCTKPFRCPYGMPGDRLIVKEGLRRSFASGIEYQADGKRVGVATWPWEKRLLPSMFMPRWASRITLELTDVRIERLQHISDTDAVAEGIPYREPAGDFGQAVHDFRRLWDEINLKRSDGKYQWAANPFVWVLSLKRVST